MRFEKLFSHELQLALSNLAFCRLLRRLSLCDLLSGLWLFFQNANQFFSSFLACVDSLESYVWLFVYRFGNHLFRVFNDLDFCFSFWLDCFFIFLLVLISKYCLVVRLDDLLSPLWNHIKRLLENGFVFLVVSFYLVAELVVQRLVPLFLGFHVAWLDVPPARIGLL